MTLPTHKLEVDFDNGAFEQSLDTLWGQATALSTNRFTYVDFSTVADYTVQAGDVLHYEVWWDTSQPASPAAIAFDYESASFVSLRATTAVDQNGLDTHPQTDLSTFAQGKWYRRIIALPASHVGLTVAAWLLACEGDSSGTYHGKFRNITIRDGTATNSTVRRSVWQTGDAEPTFAFYQRDSTNNQFVSALQVPSFDDGSWTDISTFMWSANVRRGRQHELDRTEAGTLTVVLNNRERTFDPTYAAGTYYGRLLPMRRIRLSAQYNNATYRLFSGYVEGWPQQFSVGEAQTVRVQAVDGFKILSLCGLRGSTYDSELTHTRVSNVLDDVGWSTGDRSISTGLTYLASADFTSADQNALGHLQQVAQSEIGRLYIRGDGKLRFDDRHTPLNSTNQLTLTESHIRSMVIVNSDAQLWNEITVQNASGVAQQTSNTTSIRDYGRRTLSRTGLLVEDDNECADQATFLIQNYADPPNRVTEVAWRGESDPATLWPQIGRELGERVTVDVAPRQGAASSTGNHITQISFIEGVEHDLQRGGHWDTRWRLSALTIAYTLGQPWLLGNSSHGQLSSDTYLRY